MTESPPVPARRHLVVTGATPYTRGVDRGRQLRDTLPEALATYLRLFAVLGVSERDVPRYADRLAEATQAWDPRLVEEVAGVADGAGLEPWQVMALNGRTEVLAGASGLPAKECSALAWAPAGRAPLAAQTWDWHEDLDAYWHTQEVAGGRFASVGMAEHGMLAKVGVNEAGVGVLLNILGHRDDAPTGVPVHLLLAAVLERAATVDEAVALLRDAPVSSSSALTLVDSERAVVAELSPHGLGLLEPQDGVLVHTNHFRVAELARGDKRERGSSASWDRYDHVVDRVGEADGIGSVDALVGYLRSQPGAANVCCVPAPGASFGDRWATLATVALEPGRRRAWLRSGSPLDAGRPWRLLTAGR